MFLGEVWIIDSPGEVLLHLAGEGSAGPGEPEEAGGPLPGSRALPAERTMRTTGDGSASTC